MEEEKTTILSQQRTNLSIERTVMSADRTLMAWTRTSLSLISFGFTIYKVLLYMQEEGKPLALRNPNGPRNFGLALMAIGVISLLFASIQNWSLRKKLQPEKKWHFNLTFAVAAFIGLVGLLALMNTLFRIGPF